jgi:hypothetical protein
MGTPGEWLVTMLNAFNKGDIAGFEKVSAESESAIKQQPALVGNAQVLSLALTLSRSLSCVRALSCPRICRLLRNNNIISRLLSRQQPALADNAQVVCMCICMDVWMYVYVYGAQVMCACVCVRVYIASLVVTAHFAVLICRCLFSLYLLTKKTLQILQKLREKIRIFALLEQLRDIPGS